MGSYSPAPTVGAQYQRVKYTGDGAASKKVTVAFLPRVIFIEAVGVAENPTICAVTPSEVFPSPGLISFVSAKDNSTGKYATATYVDVGELATDGLSGDANSNLQAYILEIIS